MAAGPEVLMSFDPTKGLRFLVRNPAIAFSVLGAVALAVTGAEAFYADLGHFGRKPVIVARSCLALPSLIPNCLGQGALVPGHPEVLENPFFNMALPGLLPFLVVLAATATVIAAQAMRSGAFSMGLAAIQLGLLPRLSIRHTSPEQSGQI